MNESIGKSDNRQQVLVQNNRQTLVRSGIKEMADCKEDKKAGYAVGNFATRVYLHCSAADSLDEEAERVVAQGMSRLAIIPRTERHLSLSKTVQLKHFQLLPFLERLSTKLRTVSAFEYSLTSDVALLLSETQPKRFYAFKVNVGKDKVTLLHTRRLLT